jgi:sporulation protein YlmC with PRC-barrel domain
VITDGGAELGTIADLYFDEATGRVVGYEVSDGSLSGITNGSSYLPSERIRTVGADVVVTTEEPLADVDGTGRGPSQDRVADSRTVGGAPVGAEPGLTGARSGRDVFDRTGAVVVASGQVITPEIMERARDADVMQELYDAAGVQRPGAERPDATEALSKAADTAADLWARFTSGLSEMTDAAGQRIDAQQTRARLDRINDAIGRPVTKVFLDRDDSVILDLGDLVTHQAVQRAADAGLLDSLLACVYTGGEISFTREEMRAEIAGDSTVDKASGGASVVTELEQKVEGQGQSSAERPAEARWEPAEPVDREDDAEAASPGEAANPRQDPAQGHAVI